VIYRISGGAVVLRQQALQLTGPIAHARFQLALILSDVEQLANGLRFVRLELARRPARFVPPEADAPESADAHLDGAVKGFAIG
jgi:hypothetical protein